MVGLDATKINVVAKIGQTVVVVRWIGFFLGPRRTFQAIVAAVSSLIGSFLAFRGVVGRVNVVADVKDIFAKACATFIVAFGGRCTAVTACFTAIRNMVRHVLTVL